MKIIDVLLVMTSLSLIVWILFLRNDSESFAGSDWNSAFRGPAIWNGWNYATAPPYEAPHPEDTSYLN